MLPNGTQKKDRLESEGISRKEAAECERLAEMQKNMKIILRRILFNESLKLTHCAVEFARVRRSAMHIRDLISST